MRRVTVYTAGLMLATGASLALAGPVSAATPSDHGRPCCNGGSSSYQDRQPSYGHDRRPSFHQDRQPSFGQDRRPSFGQDRRQPGFGRQPIQNRPGHQSSTTNQYVYNISVLNQFILSNVGNTLIGTGNSSNSGGVNASNVISQVGGIGRG
ncbi:hypothetical protein [Actinoplanes derwentensis]|uniref:Secreted protein n=1 Tax=Actinoplanes derwentensis TaxID=113562 RepID=A0A1H2CW97_9ACTN|nr:hypothetical protein [Actinoplanes derwentensis]GID87853.1 hypothetical protein Ade03nite_67770 [Actinoplanes derwentensis]SDT74810.1 hypothetical protein SAMN04489716_7103 [Actinoplanes derwentensis]